MREVGGRALDLQRDRPSSSAPATRASWLIAAPPAAKFATIWRVTSAGKGRHALRGDAMRAGEDDDLHLVELRHVAALPARQPGDELLQPAEAALRLGQRVLAASAAAAAAVVAGRQVLAGGAQCIEGREVHGQNLRDRMLSEKWTARDEQHGDLADLLQRAERVAGLAADLVRRQSARKPKNSERQADDAGSSAAAEAERQQRQQRRAPARRARFRRHRAGAGRQGRRRGPAAPDA